MAGSPLPSPKGTRDFYPIEMARRRWIEDKWRRVAIRHGFEEIDGPTFEQTDLYTRKSGDGIVGEIFGVYSGKDEEAVRAMGAKLAAGERGAIAPFALRPEFTPTLARMYAARAKQLPQPCKWFWQGPCFRAERPQRGRLREFWQWNCDVLGGGASSGDAGAAESDAEVIACCVDLLRACGLTAEHVRVRVNHRQVMYALLSVFGIPTDNHVTVLDALDKMPKLDTDAARRVLETVIADEQQRGRVLALRETARSLQTDWINFRTGIIPPDLVTDTSVYSMLDPLKSLIEAVKSAELTEWIAFDPRIVRGLAYYTGTVFEVIVDGERAVAGGGRYDNLIETFGGPPTPAVGFGMGDVVLSLVLQDKGLMPPDAVIARELGLRPDAFVISNGAPESDALIAPTLADLRRRGLHARRSYKSTKNIGKLLKDAADAGARYALIIEGPGELTLKDLDGNTQDRGPREAMLTRIAPPAPPSPTPR